MCRTGDPDRRGVGVVDGPSDVVVAADVRRPARPRGDLAEFVSARAINAASRVASELQIMTMSWL